MEIFSVQADKYNWNQSVLEHKKKKKKKQVKEGSKTKSKFLLISPQADKYDSID